ncbi:uncharacterized protein C8Q71DRAFT_773607 [Rhodofomes roseus]|uniref:Uncharacterized protein n=1 Tax=Rhodofomes roseus TaxID=34475 RepID=A0ABQ8K847_9APHY|nr:uncharacterized protein C8Q71DRAFT_773607 [Rhodofomes roseus]KAH9833467.1 hypothetical protein C8Q71DRAFT_773607 [Rhodofomes roseus]
MRLTRGLERVSRMRYGDETFHMPQAWPPARTSSLLNFITSTFGSTCDTPSRSPLVENSNMPPRNNSAHSPTTSKNQQQNGHSSKQSDKQENKAQQASRPKGDSAASTSNGPDRISMASTMSTASTLKATEIVGETAESLEHLGKAFGEFAQQITKLSQLGAELETAEIVNRLRKMMDVEDERLEKEIEGIKVLQDEVIKKDVIEHLKIAVENDVSDLIDQLVAEQVTILLPDHIPSALLDELARHKRELDEVEVDLHNSESRLANAQIRTSDLTEQLRTIQRADKTVSQHFPADLQGLIAMDDASVKSLMRYYALSDISDSQDRNLNRLMLFLGLSYQLVPTSAGGNVLAKISPSSLARM